MTEGITAERDTISSEPAQAARLRDAAYNLARDQGLASLSARRLSKITGMSPSALNYYFGNRDLLISEIATRAIQTSHGWRDERATAHRKAAPSWADLNHVFVGLLQNRLDESHAVLALLQELEHEPIDDKPAIMTALSTEISAEATFWRDLATSYDTPPAAAELWANLALGLTGLMLSESDASRRSEWLAAPAERLHRRLRRRPVELLALGGPDAAGLAGPPLANETARSIVDAALAVIAERGPERLGQRDVAARAGLSLAGVTYFFRTKSDLIRAAFAELCRRHCVTLADEIPDAPPAAVEKMLAFDDKGSLSGMTAMDALLRAAARMPELAETAGLIRRTRGVASFVLLRRLGLAVDHLDAYVWACLLAGRYRRIRFLPPEAQRIEMLHSARQMLAVLFGPALPADR